MSFVPGQIYTVRKSLVTPGAVTNLRLKAHATRPIVLLSFGYAPTTAQTVNTTIGVQLGRIPTTFGTATDLVAGDFVPHNPNSPTTGVQVGAGLSGHTCTVEPTYTDTWTFGFNVLNEYMCKFLPEERIPFNAATGLGIKASLALTGTWVVWATYLEL